MPAGPFVVVVVLHWNGLDDTLGCLDSLARQTYPGLRLLVVDNGSTLDARPGIGASHPAVEVLRLSENRGWAGGNNAGVSAALRAGAEYVLLLNNDTVARPELVERLVAASRAAPAVGVLGAAIRSASELDSPGSMGQLDDTAGVFAGGARFARSGRPGFLRDLAPAPADSPPRPVDVVNGCCMLISRAALERVGRFDERFFLVHEEADFCLRAGHRGIGRAVLSEPLLWHRRHASFRRAGLHLQAYYDTRNLALLVRKHVPQAARARALCAWLDHARYRYDEAREAGQTDRARAVAAGVVDAARGRYGRWSGCSAGAALIDRALAGARVVAALRRAGMTRSAVGGR
jgi:GT2 family glycosyltransferase